MFLSQEILHFSPNSQHTLSGRTSQNHVGNVKSASLKRYRADFISELSFHIQFSVVLMRHHLPVKNFVNGSGCWKKKRTERSNRKIQCEKGLFLVHVKK